MLTHPLAAVLAEHPTLTAYGFENSEEADPDEMAERSAELRRSEATFDAACVWIREHLPPTPRSRGYYSSYYLKHLAEAEIGYLSNGLFIAAMIHCGHRFRQPGRGNPNAYFPLHKRKVTALDKRRVVGLDRRAERRRRARTDSSEPRAAGKSVQTASSDRQADGQLSANGYQPMAISQWLSANRYQLIASRQSLTSDRFTAPKAIGQEVAHGPEGEWGLDDVAWPVGFERGERRAEKRGSEGVKNVVELGGA